MFNNTMRDFLSGVGATAVSMAFAEVVPALNSGVVDCAVTGSLSGNTAGWPEVAKSLYPMSLGWSINVMAVNLATWNRLDKRVQSSARPGQGLRRQDVGHAEESDQRGRQLQYREAALHHGQAGESHHRAGEAGLAETHKKLVEGAVLAGWAKRCGGECAAEWNNTVGKALNLEGTRAVGRK